MHALSQKLDTLLKLSSKLVGIEEVPEQRLIKAINKTAEEERLLEKVEEESTEKKRGLFDVVKGLLPGRKKERSGKGKEAKGVKMVTPIEKKPKKKG